MVPCQVVENRKSTPDSGRCCSSIGAAAQFSSTDEGNEHAAGRDDRNFDPNVNQHPPR